MAAGDQMSPAVSRRKLLLSLGADDIFEVIREAIAVAAQSHPRELEQRRDSILQMLQAAKASAAVGEAAVPVSEQVARINSLLVGEAISDEAAIESLRALKAVPMTFETLEATKIGRTVGGLRKHASGQVRQLAIGLYKSWKAMADEHFRSSRSSSATSTSAVVAEEASVKTAAPLPSPTSKPSGSNQETQTPASRETPKDAERVRDLPSKLKEAPLSISDEARLARAKRKLKDAYQEAAAVKKQRSTIKVVNVPASSGVIRQHTAAGAGHFLGVHLRS